MSTKLGPNDSAWEIFYSLQQCPKQEDKQEAANPLLLELKKNKSEMKI